MNKNKPRAMEFLWIFLSIVSLAIAVHNSIIDKGFMNSWKFFAFFAVCLGMFYIRKKMRENEK